MGARACLLASWLGLLVLGCGPSPVQLTVRIQSGLRAGDELRHARARILSGSVPCASPGELASDGRELARSDQPALGEGSVTIAEIGPLAPGIYTVHVAARRPGAGGPDSGPVLIERCVVTSVTHDRVLRVPLTTDCVGVTCPTPAGSPAFDQCLNGRCVDPRCDPGDPSTAPFCCDRSALGSACDEVPTLCRAAIDCTPTLECGGTPTCEGGVCVEPAEDACADDQYCDATTTVCTPIGAPPADGGLGDAGMDAFVESLDGYGVDAPSPDATAADARAPTDTDEHDALDVLEGADASSVPGEDCTRACDDDLDGLADCADSECAGSVLCVAGCGLPVSISPPPSVPDIGAPAHWYRADVGVILTTSGSRVCAWRDLAGTAHFLAPVGGLPALSSLSGQPAIQFASMSQSLVTPSSLGTRWEGDFTTTVVSFVAGPTVLSSLFTTGGPGYVSFSMLTTGGSGRARLELRMGASFLRGAETSISTRRVETVRVATLRAGDELSTRVQHHRDGSELAVSLTGGTGLAERFDATGFSTTLGPSLSDTRIAEVIVHDRRLGDAEVAALHTYLLERYPP